MSHIALTVLEKWERTNVFVNNMAEYSGAVKYHCPNCKLLQGRGCCCELGVCIKYKGMRPDFEADWQGHLLWLGVKDEDLRDRIIRAIADEINR